MDINLIYPNHHCLNGCLLTELERNLSSLSILFSEAEEILGMNRDTAVFVQDELVIVGILDFLGGGKPDGIYLSCSATLFKRTARDCRHLLSKQ